jgi:site-specific DNA-cytosine methylase
MDSEPFIEELTGRSFHEGTSLDEFARHVVKKAITLVGRPHLTGPRLMKIGSGCTGSAMDIVGLDALARSLKAEQVPIDFVAAFHIESDKSKRAWCCKVHEALHEQSLAQTFPRPCAFTDISVYADDRRRVCDLHKGVRASCEIPQFLDGFIAGFSCKDFARCNMNRKHRSGADIVGATTSPGKSADTLQGVFQVLDHSKPDWGVLENVDELAQELHKDGLDMIFVELEKRGFDAKGFVLDSHDYGMAQSKKRLFIVLIRRPNRSFAVDLALMPFFQRFEMLLGEFKVRGPCFSQILLSSDHPKVEHELTHRQGLETKNWDSSTMDIHQAEWRKLGLCIQAVRARAEDRESPWFLTLPSREKDLLAYYQRLYGQRTLEHQARRALSMLSSSINMLAGGTFAEGLSAEEPARLRAPTILPKDKLWISIDEGDAFYAGDKHHRYVLGFEALTTIGFPTNRPDFKEIVAGEKDRFLHDLAGNAFASTVVVAVVTSILFAAEYKEAEAAEVEGGSENSRSNTSDARSALQLLKRLRANPQ